MMISCHNNIDFHSPSFIEFRASNNLTNATCILSNQCRKLALIRNDFDFLTSDKLARSDFLSRRSLR